MTLTWVDVFSLISSLFSIALAIFAIWLSLKFYFQTRDTEASSQKALNNIEKESKTLNTVSWRLIDKLTDYMDPSRTERLLSEVIKSYKPVEPIKAPEDLSNNPNKDLLDQWRVDNLIAALYYAAVSNIALQMTLPSEGLKTPQAGLVDQSKVDYDTLKRLIQLSKQERLMGSPNKHMYDRAITLEPSLSTAAEYYSITRNPPSTAPNTAR